MNKKNIFKWVIAIAIIALVGFLIFRLTADEEVRGEEITVEKGDIATYYNFSGNIEPKKRDTIFAESPIQISEFLVEENESVKKDDILYETSTGQGVKSTIDGEVTSIQVEEDEQIAPGTQIIEVADYDDLQLRVNVDEFDLNAIDVGTEVEVEINALDKTVDGEIIDIAKEASDSPEQGVSIDDGVTFFETIISISETENIRVGMSAEAKVLDEESKGTNILPMSAIEFKSDNTPYVNIKKDNQLEEKEIELGITDGVNVEVKSGLETGDKVFIEEIEQDNFGPPEGVNTSDDEAGGDSSE